MRLGRAAHVAAALLFALATIIVSSSSRRSTGPRHRASTTPAGQLQLRTVRAGSGQTVVLIHGYGESLIAWQPVFDQLAGDHDVIAFDLPGFGLSSKPPTGYRAEPMARAMLAALDALEIDSAVIVGHSLGGAVAAAMAVLAPERVRGLVLIDPAIGASPWLVPDTAAGGGRQMVRSAITRYEMLRTRFTAPHAAAWLIESDSALAYIPAQDSAYARSLNAVLEEFEFDWLTAERAATIRAPTLVIWGRLDAMFTVDQGRRLAEGIGARFAVIERSWHRPHVERPAETAGVLRGFLAELGAIRPR